MAYALRDYFVLEARHSARRAPLAVAVFGILAVVLSHAILPAMPARPIQLMEMGLRIHGMPEVLLVNDLMAVYFAGFFVGAAGLLESIVVAREEHRLEILLAKPLRASMFLLGRTAPALASTLVVGALVSAATAVALLPFLGDGSSVSAWGAFGAGLFATAVAFVQLAALELAFVSMRDGFHGLLVASIVWIATVMPTAVLIYRPDLFEGRAMLADATVLSSLVWHVDVLRFVGPLALAAALPIGALLVRLAAARLERRESL